MCCFSRKVDSVSQTKIFARSAKGAGQFLVYSMNFKAGEDLAMILPIPVPKNSAEDAVRFINLEKYSDFFADLHKGFPTKSLGAPPRTKDGPPPPAAKLAVVEVGSFVASFVPAIKDFARLDEQFRLPNGVWEKLPQYANFGFAVFKLKKGNQKVHPMAFEFPRADKDMLFFPTVHIHDGGTVPMKAHFDHALFCQIDGMVPMSWEESPQLADAFVKVKETQGIVAADKHVYRKLMDGMFENKDVGI